MIVDVHGVQVKAHFFVVDKIDQANCLLLGSPYQQLVELSIWRMSDGAVACVVKDPVTGETVEFEIEEEEFE